MPRRIPIRFMGEERRVGQSPRTFAIGEGGDLTPEEIGEQSIYEDQSEVGRRVDRGAERDTPRGRERADEKDKAGGPKYNDLPEERKDRDTNERATQSPGSIPKPAAQRDSQPQGDAGSGSAASVSTELLTTRAELRRVQEKLDEINTERKQELECFSRRQADFENYRKRVERERTETYSGAVSDVVREILPVLDNFQWALEAESSLNGTDQGEFRQFVEGVHLISNQLHSLLSKLGVESIVSVGQPFDPHLHEAIATERREDMEPDVIVDELLPGYKLGDKLIRPAKVKVAVR